MEFKSVLKSYIVSLSSAIEFSKLIGRMSKEKFMGTVLSGNFHSILVIFLLQERQADANATVYSGSNISDNRTYVVSWVFHEHKCNY